ncbi:hypothetical protein NQ317_001663, partial [Molorchus minor]
VLLLLIWKWGVMNSKGEKNSVDLQSSYSDKVFYQYVTPVVPFSDVGDGSQTTGTYGYSTYIPSNLSPLSQAQIPRMDLHTLIEENPLLAALLLSASLGLAAKPSLSNNSELLPTNPYIALLLSKYGRYVPYRGSAKGIYAYAASNNYHNNKPFGSYKVHEDAK